MVSFCLSRLIVVIVKFSQKHLIHRTMPCRAVQYHLMSNLENFQFNLLLCIMYNPTQFNTHTFDTDKSMCVWQQMHFVFIFIFKLSFLLSIRNLISSQQQMNNLSKIKQKKRILYNKENYYLLYRMYYTENCTANEKNYDRQKVNLRL